MESSPFNVLVADDLPIVSGGLVGLLGHITTIHIHPLAVRDNAQLQNLLAVREMDLLMASPDFCGGFDFEQFAERHPTVPCLAIVSSVAQLSKLPKGLRFVSISDSAERIAEVVESFRRRKIAPQDSGGEAEQAEALSQREKEIVACLAKGMPNKEIADRLCLSVYTVQTHRRNIIRKTHIRSLSGLTIYAIANNLIDVKN